MDRKLACRNVRPDPELLLIPAGTVRLIYGRHKRGGASRTEQRRLIKADGGVVRGSAGKMTVSDGPFAESKEVIGGFWLLEASSYEEVQAFLKDHPHLEAGTLEVRQIRDM